MFTLLFDNVEVVVVFFYGPFHFENPLLLDFTIELCSNSTHLSLKALPGYHSQVSSESSECVCMYTYAYIHTYIYKYTCAHSEDYNKYV